MKKVRLTFTAFILLAAAVLAIPMAAPASAQTPGDKPELHFHTVVTSATSTINITSIPNSRSTLRLQMRGQSTDTNTTSKVSYVRAELNGDTNSYSFGYVWWLFNCCSGTNWLYNASGGGQIGQITDSSSTADAEGSGAITCTWVGYSQATWDHLAHCEQVTSEVNSNTGLSFINTAMIWRPSSPAAINRIELHLNDNSQFDVGTIVDLWLE